MKTSVERRENNLVALTVEIPAEELQKAVDRAYRRLAPRLRIPGFRPGKAPRSVVEMRLGKEHLVQEAVEEVVPKAYSSAIRERALEPVDQPQIRVTQAEEGKPLIFEAEVWVTPEVKLGEYKGLEAERPLRPVTDADVERVLASLQEQQARLVAVERPIQNGDFITMDFAGLLDGKPFRGGAANDYTMQVGSGTFLPGFEEGLVGMSTGETKEIPVTFPEDYTNPELAGKEATFTVKVKTVREKQLPQLDDELAKSAGDFDTLEQLRLNIRQRLEQQAEREADGRAEEALVKKVVASSEVDVPEVMIKREVDHMLHHFRVDLAYRGIKLEQYLEATGKTEDDLRQELTPQATENVKTELCLRAIARAEGLLATEDEIKEETERHINTSGNPAEARQQWESEAGQDTVRKGIEIGKAIRFIREQARLKTVVLPEAENSQGAEAEAKSEAESEAAPEGSPNS